MPAELERADTPAVIAPPPVIFLLGLLGGWTLQHFAPRSLVPRGMAIPLAVILLAAGAVGFAGILAFRRAGTSPNPYQASARLVTRGPYRFTRNPMYLGFTLIYLAITVWINSVWPLLILPVVLLVMHYGVVRREEAYLERRFGREYREYRARVRRWL